MKMETERRPNGQGQFEEMPNKGNAQAIKLGDIGKDSEEYSKIIGDYTEVAGGIQLGRLKIGSEYLVTNWDGHVVGIRDTWLKPSMFYDEDAVVKELLRKIEIAVPEIKFNHEETYISDITKQDFIQLIREKLVMPSKYVAAEMGPFTIGRFGQVYAMGLGDDEVIHSIKTRRPHIPDFIKLGSVVVDTKKNEIVDVEGEVGEDLFSYRDEKYEFTVSRFTPKAEEKITTRRGNTVIVNLTWDEVDKIEEMLKEPFEFNGIRFIQKKIDLLRLRKVGLVFEKKQETSDFSYLVAILKTPLDGPVINKDGQAVFGIIDASKISYKTYNGEGEWKYGILPEDVDTDKAYYENPSLTSVEEEKAVIAAIQEMDSHGHLTNPVICSALDVKPNTERIAWNLQVCYIPLKINKEQYGKVNDYIQGIFREDSLNLLLNQ